jgi:hypothetical protein
MYYVDILVLHVFFEVLSKDCIGSDFFSFFFVANFSYWYCELILQDFKKYMEDKNIHVIHILSPDSPMMSLSKNILSCVPCCRFLWIVRSWLPIRCSLTLVVFVFHPISHSNCCLGYILFCPIVINIESYRSICYKNL